MVQIETLPNGVRIVTEPMDTVRSAALGIWVGGGSREEAPSESGAAHFFFIARIELTENCIRTVFGIVMFQCNPLPLDRAYLT